MNSHHNRGPMIPATTGAVTPCARRGDTAQRSEAAAERRQRRRLRRYALLCATVALCATFAATLEMGVAIHDTAPGTSPFGDPSEFLRTPAQPRPQLEHASITMGELATMSAVAGNR